MVLYELEYARFFEKQLTFSFKKILFNHTSIITENISRQV